MIKLIKKGAPTKAEREIRNKMNDYLDMMSADNRNYFSNQKYTSFEDLEKGFSEMQAKESFPVNEGSVNDISNEQSIQSEPHNQNSSEPVAEKFNDFDDDFGQIPDDFDPDPNIGDTKQKGYNQIAFDQSVQTIPEPVFSQEKIVDNADANDFGGASGNEPIQNPNQPQNNQQQVQQKPQPIQSPNPDLQDADEKTKRIAATLFVDRILLGYAAAHKIIEPLVLQKEKKIIDLERKGLIDPNDRIIVNAKGGEATLREIVEKTNEGITETLTPDPTFDSSVRPAMIREFTKRGYGLTDMQTILIAFGQDIGMKAVQIIGVKSKLNQIIDIFKEGQKEKKKAFHEASKRHNAVNPDSVSMNPENAHHQEPEEQLTETEEVHMR